MPRPDLVAGIPPRLAVPIAASEMSVARIDTFHAEKLGSSLAEHDRQAIGFLARAAGGRPESQAPAAAAHTGVDEIRQNLVLQGIEGVVVAKEERFLRRDYVDDFLLQHAVAGGRARSQSSRKRQP